MKRWVDLLGTDTEGVVLDGRFISRRLDQNAYAVLWAFPSRKEAKEVLQAWRKEVAGKE